MTSRHSVRRHSPADENGIAEIKVRDMSRKRRETKRREEFDSLIDNCRSLEQFRDRYSFHDAGILDVRCVAGRVIVTMDEYTLVLIDVKNVSNRISALPTAWLFERLTAEGGAATLHVEAEKGTIDAEFRNLRLLRNRDLTILVPNID